MSAARLEAVILGCGSSGGVPRADGAWGACDPAEPRNARTRCSLLVRRAGEGGPSRQTTLVVDTAPEFRQQMAAAGARRLDAVLISHDHADQCHGLDDIRAFALTQRELIPCFADAATRRTLQTRFGYVFQGEGLYPAIATLGEAPAHGVSFAVAGPSGAIPVITFDQDHGPVRSLGFRFGDLAYSSDVVDLPQSAFEALAGLDVWIVDAMRRTPHPTHAHLSKTLGWIETVAPRRAILTNLHVDLDYRTLLAELPPNVVPAFDGMRIWTDIEATAPLKLAFLASHNGTSLRAIVAAIEAGELAAVPVLAVANRRDAAALDFARAHAIPARHIPTVPDADAADGKLLGALEAAGAELVLLSGYLRKLGPRVLRRFAGAILNVHPALLPRHGGEGMYGRRVHEAVLAAKDRVTGASVHLVDQDYDHGEVLARAEVPVRADDTPATLQARVMAAEPGLYIEVLRAIGRGAYPMVRIGGERP